MIYEHENTEWHCAVNDLTELDRARHEDPETHADLLSVGGARL